MNHITFINNNITNRYYETKALGYQCVAMVKLYAKFVDNISLGSFNGSANKVTYKIGGTYDPRYYHRYNAGPGVDLKQGDHLIQELGQHGHIGIVHRADKNGYYMLSQNDGEYHKNTRGNGDGQGNNAIMMRYYRWSDRPILHIFRKK